MGSKVSIIICCHKTTSKARNAGKYYIHTNSLYFLQFIYLIYHFRRELEATDQVMGQSGGGAKRMKLPIPNKARIGEFVETEEEKETSEIL